MANDLPADFPEMKGFCRAHRMPVHAFGEAWLDEKVVQQVVGHLPWFRSLVAPGKRKKGEGA